MEEKEAIKEYAIYCIYNGGTPFILNTFKSLQQAKLQIYNMVATEEERNRIFYVDNDFYENKHSELLQGKYFKIIERSVGEWKNYQEYKENITKKQNRNNIIQFKQNIS